MGLLRRPLSIRAGVVLQLALVATASLTLLAVFALKVIEVTLQRRHVEAGISVAGVVRGVVEKEVAANPGSPNVSAGMFPGSLSPYINEVVLLPDPPPEGPPRVIPVGEKAFPFLPVYPTVDVILPFGPLSPPSASAAAPAPRGIRVRFHSPGIEGEVRTLVNVTLLLAAIDVAVLVLFGGIVLDRTVISPVRKLAAAAEKVAAGDYSLRVEGVEGNEVGQLAASFNRMVEGILEAQERLRRSEKETFRSEKLATVGRLAAGVAHEVGNPLMAIRGYAEHLLKHDPGPAASMECLEKVVEETRKMENIVRGLLSVASPGGGREGATDVNAVARETVGMLSYRNLFRDVEVRMELGETPRAAILEERFRQVFLNLVINAVDAMRGRGRLTLKTWVMEGWSRGEKVALRRRASDPPQMDGTPLRASGTGAGKGVALSVTDTGGGIPAGDLPLLFDPFFTTKEPGKGTGLGLSVSRTIVEGAGGEIRAESEEGRGATFTVVLPSARGTAVSGGGKRGAMADRILVVDDEASLRDALGRILTAEGYEVRQAGDGKEALGILGDSPFDFVLCDLRMPVMGGLDLLREITARGIPGTVIMMSAFGTVETAVEAMKLGAYDYVSKPFMSDEILLTLRKAAERERLRSENAFLRSEIERTARPEEILYASRPMEEVVRTAGKVKDYDATVLVTGESGTGKELVARLLHFGGRRKGKPFVALNCGAIPETLLESELFGHRRGAFTEAKSDRAGLIEEAAGGTLFLDEIGEFPPPLQTKLLRFLQDGEIRRLGDTETRKVNVRLVAATARDLEREVAGGRFREDLFYRLNVIRIHVPPLRERRDDIPLLARHFLSHYCGKYGKREMLLSADALDALSGHEWRGNVRELRNLMERCALLASGAEVSRAGLLAVWKGSGASGGSPSGPALEIRVPVSPERPDLKAAVRELERQLIRIALERTGGSRPKAAELLGISHPTLLYKAKEFGIEGG